MKLVLVVNGLDSGGAEKSTIKLCEGFISDAHEVILITISSYFDFYTLDSSILRIDLGDSIPRRRRHPSWTGVNRPLHWFDSIKKILRLRKLLLCLEPDCIISISAKVAVFTFFSSRFLKYPQIGSERIHPDSNVYSHGAITDLLRPFIYRMGTVLSVQTSGVVKWCQDNWNTSSYLTPNHLTNFPSELELKASLPVTMRKDEVLVIARDHPQKNLDFLLASWVYVEKSNPNAYLTIVGPEFPSRIENLANNLGLRNLSVQIRTEHLSEFFNKSKLFVSTSLFEGFPNVVLEAFSYGVPVITTPSCDVVEDFAKAGAAIVVYSQNPTEFADVLVQALEGKDELLEISHNALAISKNYSWEQVRTSWYAAIAAAINMH